MAMNFPGTLILAEDASCGDVSEMKETIATRSMTNSSADWHTLNGDISEEGSREFSHHTRLQGRNEEIVKMKECFVDVANDGAARLLMVAGVSGSGKSCLVQQMRDFVTSTQRNGFFCEGKFEQSLRNSGGTNEPFSALTTAFSDVIDFTLNRGEMLKERAQDVAEAVGSNASMLVDLVPNLSLLLKHAGSPHMLTATYSDSMVRRHEATTNTSTNLVILFRNFLRSLTSKEAPILLFLDDLQFADDDSLDVFRAMATDSSLKHVLIVGSYRSNETSLAQLLKTDVSSSHQSSTLSTTTINVGDLSLSAINVGLAEKLVLDEETTEPLSKIVLQKSGGNPFYVTQYLTMLQEKQLIFYDEENEQWTWDAEEILMMTDISNNVLDLVSKRLQELPDKVRVLLTLISFIGFRFDLGLVEIIVRQLAATKCATSHQLENQGIIDKVVSLLRESTCLTENLAAIEGILEKAVRDGLIEKCSDTIFKFTHDRIQQALYELVKTETARSELHYYIGHSLDLCTSEVAKVNLFFVAEQLNRGASHITEDEEMVELAVTNLRVGKAAASQAAYQSAASYMRSGMHLLGDMKYWSTHYPLMVDLFSSTAEIEAKASNFERARELCETVLQRALSLDDKIRAYVCLVSLYCIEDAMDDAVRVGMEFISQVGINIPKNPNLAHVMLNRLQTKRCMHNVSNSMILESPLCSERKIAKAMEVLNRLATAYYFMSSISEMFLIIVMKVVQLSRRFGLAETSAHGFALYGMLCSSMGDGKQALRYGNLALALIESPAHDNSVVESRVLTLVNHFVKWWEVPLQECTEPFMRGVNIGKQQGELEWAYFCVGGVIATMIHSGYHLYETLEVARKLGGETIEYEVHSADSIVLPLWQLVENLTGHGDNQYKLTGNAMDEDEMIQLYSDEQNKNLLALSVIGGYRLIAAVLFQRWDLAWALSPLVFDGFKFLDCHFLGFSLRLYLGLACSERYLRHGKQKDLRKLLKIMRKVKQLEKAGVVDCKAVHLVLQAELAAANCSGKLLAQKEMVKVKAMYVKAIEQCYAQNLVHYQAITNERALRFCLLHNDLQGAVEFLEESELCFRDWGADAKLELMEEFYFHLANNNE